MMIQLKVAFVGLLSLASGSVLVAGTPSKLVSRVSTEGFSSLYQKVFSDDPKVKPLSREKIRESLTVLLKSCDDCESKEELEGLVEASQIGEENCDPHRIHKLRLFSNHYRDYVNLRNYLGHYQREQVKFCQNPFENCIKTEMGSMKSKRVWRKFLNKLNSLRDRLIYHQSSRRGRELEAYESNYELGLPEALADLLIEDGFHIKEPKNAVPETKRAISANFGQLVDTVNINFKNSMLLFAELRSVAPNLLSHYGEFATKWMTYFDIVRALKKQQISTEKVAKRILEAQPKSHRKTNKVLKALCLGPCFGMKN